MAASIEMRAVCSLDGRAGGEVFSWEFSEADTLVFLHVGAPRARWPW